MKRKLPLLFLAAIVFLIGAAAYGMESAAGGIRAAETSGRSDCRLERSGSERSQLREFGLRGLPILFSKSEIEENDLFRRSGSSSEQFEFQIRFRILFPVTAPAFRQRLSAEALPPDICCRLPEGRAPPAAC